MGVSLPTRAQRGARPKVKLLDIKKLLCHSHLRGISASKIPIYPK
ncbi:MAG: hypothetical protein NZ455_07145 [Bacteroidia bacterium]|nr:hypothetical protein [Bacteroidia bacterium]MDW8346400.1 hypothetical protein [Bacteroidia bacterium]